MTTIVAAANTGWRLEPEGRLLEAVKCDVAIGIFLLTLGLILPLAPMSAAGRRRWLGWVTGLSIYNYLMENVQAWRGLNPRFTEVGGPVDQILGGVFFLTAVGILVLFVILMYGFFRRDALPDHLALRLALRYATVASLIAFGVGVLMSVISGRSIGARGDLMLIHAAGFHGLQAIPLIGLLVGAAAVPTPQALGTTGLGGAGWLLMCTGIMIQATMGQGPSEWTPALAITLMGG